MQSIIEPDEVMVIGGTYETPVAEGLLSEDFVEQLRLSGTFNEDSFDREYRSKWSGSVEDAFFSVEKFDKHRVLLQAEDEYSGRTKNGYYVIGVDVGRLKCTTEAIIIKVTPQPQGSSLKSIVNLFSFEAEDFEEQAIHIKKLFYKYKARAISIDANGLGVGLLDFMTKVQIDPDSGEELPPFGCCGGTTTAQESLDAYKKIKGDGVENVMYLIKANAPINTEMYTYTKSQMLSGKVKFLIDEAQAKTKLMSTKIGQNMTIEQRNDRLRPFVLTTVLKEELLNLVEENEGVNIILKQSTRGIKKDKFSAFIYGLYYVKQEDDKRLKRKKVNLSDMMFFT